MIFIFILRSTPILWLSVLLPGEIMLFHFRNILYHKRHNKVHILKQNIQHSRLQMCHEANSGRMQKQDSGWNGRVWRTGCRLHRSLKVRSSCTVVMSIIIHIYILIIEVVSKSVHMHIMLLFTHHCPTLSLMLKVTFLIPELDSFQLFMKSRPWVLNSSKYGPPWRL